MTVRVVRGRVVVLACEDNLIRGASGVAVQNFNRMFGFEERTGAGVESEIEPLVHSRSEIMHIRKPRYEKELFARMGTE